MSLGPTIEISGGTVGGLEPSETNKLRKERVFSSDTAALAPSLRFIRTIRTGSLSSCGAARGSSVGSFLTSTIEVGFVLLTTC
jgi:hypothetical protein